ncbi:MAG: DNA-3-methyladenine glycosylase 2 family protein [Actinomycetota bacterium]|nr:DNA-3-methyladenine glycosylase 2 family protein [Actinomycetota bacterium]
MELVFDACYAAASAKDARFDGVFFTAVTSTGIYCRPSCPAMTPKRSNVRFYATAAAAQLAGFRACKRCRPDASPGSPEWNVRADLVARAMRLIADGMIDRDGVGGLARALHVSERHLHRQLVAEVGAGPQAIARAYRAQTARLLIETTPMSFSEIAFAAGFASIRQFNDTVQRIFATTPTGLRAKRHSAASPPGEITLRLPFRAPFHGASVLDFFGLRAIGGIESYDSKVYRRTLSLPHSTGITEMSLQADHVRCTLRLQDVRDLSAAVQRCRRMLDLDADPVAIDAALAKDPLLQSSIKKTPGRRVPGTVSGAELAIRAVIGQQISVKGASTVAGKLVAALGKPLTAPVETLSHTFPTPEAVVDSDLAMIGMPQARRRTLRLLADSIAKREIDVDPGADREATRSRLLAIPGIGPWTADYIVMRALGDPDAFLPTDLGVVHGLKKLGHSGPITARAERWRPWRAYAQQHLWAALEN